MYFLSNLAQLTAINHKREDGVGSGANPVQVRVITWRLRVRLGSPERGFRFFDGEFFFEFCARAA